MADHNTVTLMAGGDVGPIVEPTDEFAELILPVLKQADLRFAQCERTYSERGWPPQYHVGHYGGSSTRLHPRFASIWKTAGIDVVSMASNHTMEWGPDATLDTIEMFRGWGKHVIGAGRDEEAARKPAIIEKNGVRIAFLAYCSVLREGHAAGPGKCGVAPMRVRVSHVPVEWQPGTPMTVVTEPYEQDVKALQDDIRRAREQADAVVMSIHWGIDNVPKTICTYQPPVAHAAIDAGADLILGHHPHCIRAVEVYKGKVCFYSIGNFMTTGGMQIKKPFEWNIWWYRVDPECIPPKGRYYFPSDGRKTMIVKVTFSRKGMDRVAFLPAFINPQAQPSVVAPDDPKFKEILDFTEWVSDQHPHKFRVEGGEVVVDRSA